MDKIAAALKYLNAGLCPIPTWPDAGKNPKLKDMAQFHDRLPTVAEIERWWRRWPNANIGLVTGYHNGYVGLDFDSQADYESWPGPKGQTWTVATARGYHVWFRLTTMPGRSQDYTDGQGHEVLLRAKGGYCIAPPSRHHTGVYYRTAHNVLPLEIDTIDDVLWPWQPKEAAPKPKPQQSVNPNISSLKAGLPRMEEMISIDGIRPNKNGVYKICCPFHDDNRPSAWLNVAQQRFGCNKCTLVAGKKGYLDQLNVWAALNGKSNKEAYALFMEAQQ